MTKDNHPDELLLITDPKSNNFEFKRNKAIEEMAKDIEQARIKATDTTNSMNYGFGGWYAKELYTAGYRLASDVAREIFEGIDDCYVQMLEEVDNTIEEAILEENHSLARTAKYGKDVMLLTLDTLRKRLKKKYIGEDTNVTTEESEKDDGKYQNR